MAPPLKVPPKLPLALSHKKSTQVSPTQVCALLQSVHESCWTFSHFSIWLKHDPFLCDNQYVPPVSQEFSPSAIRSQTIPTRSVTVNVPCLSIQGLILDIHGTILHRIGKLIFHFPAYGPSTKRSNETQVSVVLTSSWGSSISISSSTNVYKLQYPSPTWTISSSSSIIVVSTTSSNITAFSSSSS